MLEERIAELTKALNANTAALTGGKGAGANGGAGAAGKKAHTFEEVKAALLAVKEMKGAPAAKKIITAEGKSADLVSIKPAQFAAVMKACEAFINAPAEDEPPAEDEDTL